MEISHTIMETSTLLFDKSFCSWLIHSLFRHVFWNSINCSYKTLKLGWICRCRMTEIEPDAKWSRTCPFIDQWRKLFVFRWFIVKSKLHSCIKSPWQQSTLTLLHSWTSALSWKRFKAIHSFTCRDLKVDHPFIFGGGYENRQRKVDWNPMYWSDIIPNMTPFTFQHQCTYVFMLNNHCQKKYWPYFKVHPNSCSHIYNIISYIYIYY